MKYISTRGNAPELNFEDVIITGLAKDGGLYVPETWPQLSPNQIRSFAFKDVALQVLGRLIDHVLEKRDERATIVVATSGDTGGAAIEAFRREFHQLGADYGTDRILLYICIIAGSAGSACAILCAYRQFWRYLCRICSRQNGTPHRQVNHCHQYERYPGKSCKNRAV